MNPTETFRALGFRTQAAYQFPNIVNVEVYRGSCPCRCRHCPVGITDPRERERLFGKQGIDLALYQKIVNEVSQYPHASIRLHSVGEPLDWEDLGAALELTPADLKSWLFTSAVTRELALLEQVCRKISIVEVSVNSAGPEDYRLTKGIDAFSLVEGNIRAMRACIQAEGLPTRLIASRVQSQDEAADREFVRFWKASGLVDDAFVRSYHTYNDLIDPLMPGGAEGKHQPCLVHWARFNISAGGLAVVCFNELFKQEIPPALILGDIRQQSIAEVWTGEKLAALRKAELSEDYTGCAFADELPCKHCTSCQPLFGNNQTSEYQIRMLEGHRD